jgi:selenocysteine-specific elongation factor
VIRGIIGTGGHIDHGKTALVGALTGVSTDRLPEEQRRGITIDLGFARLLLDDGVAGVVDVPGHEDFIRNMVAGASGFDLLLLVVAADEGVMPQTREHVAIAELLAVPRAVVALTKVDRVDPDWLELVEDDVATFLEGTPFADARVVPTSVVSGQGLDTLRRAIGDALPAARGRSDDLFRLPVDRVFTVRGTGTVVTGTVWSGCLKREEQVRILPGARTARVRSLQVHGEEVDAVAPGQRAAIALAGIERIHAGRGSTLVTDPAWTAASAITASLRVLPASPWRIEHGQRLRVHLGTAEVMARAYLMGRDALEPGDEGWAQLRFEAPVVARSGDRLVIRSYSPVTTIGGGVVAEPYPGKRRRLTPEDARFLASQVGDAPQARVAAALEERGVAGVPVGALPILTGATPADVKKALATLDAVVAGDRAFAAPAARSVLEGLTRTVDAYHEAHLLRRGIDTERLRRGAPDGAEDALVAHALALLLDRGQLVMVDGLVARAGFEPSLDPEQQAARDRILAAIQDAGYAPPRLDQLAAALGEPPDLPDLIAHLDAGGEIRRLEHDLYMHRAHLDRLVDRVRSSFAGRTDVSPAEFRDLVSASRKHLIPILEYLDRTGVTVRSGEGRAVPPERREI